MKLRPSASQNTLLYEGVSYTVDNNLDNIYSHQNTVIQNTQSPADMTVLHGCRQEPWGCSCIASGALKLGESCGRQGMSYACKFSSSETNRYTTRNECLFSQQETPARIFLMMYLLVFTNS